MDPKDNAELERAVRELLAKGVNISDIVGLSSKLTEIERRLKAGGL